MLSTVTAQWSEPLKGWSQVYRMAISTESGRSNWAQCSSAIAPYVDSCAVLTFDCMRMPSGR